MVNRLRRRGGPAVVGPVVALCLAGCTAADRTSDRAAEATRPTTVAAGPTAQAGADCAHTPTLRPLEPFRVPTTNGRVTGLPFAALPTTAGTEVKIVWRITGDGVPTVRALRPDGSAGPLTFGPSLHAGSNFAAPGDEWGTGFRFDVPGCWLLDLRRGPLEGRLAVAVRP
jgi:hypothetical protein